MKTIIATTILALAVVTTASGQDSKTPATNPRQSAPGTVADPFQALLERARQSQAAWATKDDNLDDALAARNACDGQAEVKETLEAKRAELNAWADYYNKHLEYNRDRAKATSSAANTRVPQRTDLLGAIGMEERELGDLRRRLADLEETLKEKKESGNANALASLEDMAAAKEQDVQKLHRALELFDQGSRDLAEMRDLATKRIAHVQTLIKGLQIESTLYENLYAGMLHRIDLKCDRVTPSAVKREEDEWLRRTRERIK